jgi:predicted Zn-dependent protease
MKTAEVAAEISTLETSFNQLITTLLSKKAETEHFTVTLNGETSQFTRFNGGKVRQTGFVSDTWIKLTWMGKQRSSFRQFPWTGVWEVDWNLAASVLAELQEELFLLPEDPYLVLPTGNSSSREVYIGKLLVAETLVPSILEPLTGLDFTGLYAGGIIIRAYGDSQGQKHWFATDSFNLDYSIFTESGQAVKGNFAGTDWDESAYIAKINYGRQQLDLLSFPVMELPRGKYRTYFAPAAVANLLGMFSWGGFSGNRGELSAASILQGSSSLTALANGEKLLSPKLTLQENFHQVLVPRFNELGELTTPNLILIENGVLVNKLVNSRTAKEFNQLANGANGAETLRAPEVVSGNLAFGDILSRLDTGLYVSNLHYLNWSDHPKGRVTGMTRYACFWVENAKISAPIANLRFDESFYRFWGKENLVDLTDFQELIPDVDTYGSRQLGGSLVPGMLVEDFSYTL